MFKKALFLACLMATLVARVSSAGDVLYYTADQTPDPEVVARILSGPAKVVRPVKMRSIRLLDESPTTQQPATLAAQQATARPQHMAAAAHDGPTALGLPVQFAFGSADLLPQTMAQLDALAEGIRRADPEVRIIVEGHTDAVGSADYNLRLSEMRAAAVRAYLVGRHGIAPERLRTLGRGLYAPIDPRTPFAPENRRVEFRADIG
ncbi:MAG: OmpA family protein [Rhodocyclaceae bacterium]